MGRIITVEEWQNELNTNEETAPEIARFVEKLNAEAHLGHLTPILPNLWKDTIGVLNDALGIRAKKLIVCRVNQYLSTLQNREVHYTSGGNLKYAIEGCRSLSDLFGLANKLSMEQLMAFRYLFEESVGGRITTAMKLTLHPVFDQKTIGMVIAGFETAVEQYVGFLLSNAKREAEAVLPIITLFCSGNWPVCLFPEQKRFLILVA